MSSVKALCIAITSCKDQICSPDDHLVHLIGAGQKPVWLTLPFFRVISLHLVIVQLQETTQDMIHELRDNDAYDDIEQQVGEVVARRQLEVIRQDLGWN